MFAPTGKRHLELTLYRYAGRFLFFRIDNSCEECDVARAVLQRLMDGVYKDKPVTLQIKPWLDNWWKLLWRGGWRPPILTVNRRVFSQGRVPDVAELARTAARLLKDDNLEPAAAVGGPEKASFSRERAAVILYASPTCPYCKGLRAYLDRHQVAYSIKDVSASETARAEVKELTGKTAIPVLKAGKQVVVGFQPDDVRQLLGIPAHREQAEPVALRSTLPEPTVEQVAEIRHRARRVLESNWRKDRTVPSAALYPHQWNWDSGFIARGHLRSVPEKAYIELRTLFRGQWRDGFLPHIVFDSQQPAYFPGPDYWRAERSGRLPPGVQTSGIGQPPVHASMVADSPELDQVRGRALRFLEEIYPRLKALHDFYFRYRDPLGEGLVCIVHPWESGLDNAPIWDEPLERIQVDSRWARDMQDRYNRLAERGDRPKRPYIAKYSQIVENLFRKRFDWQAVAEDHPFLVQDILFNTVLCQAERDLGKIARQIGEDPSPQFDRAERLAAAINGKLWNEEAGTYYDFDLVANQHIQRETIFSYLPLYAEVCDSARARRLLQSLRSGCFCVTERNCFAVPSYDMCQADYESTFYWRGPIWVNINWYLSQGLRKYGENELAAWIETSLLDLARRRHGFWEYYDPEQGDGLGAADFSWTAALILDLAAKYSGARRRK